jgi:AcrR family transcriptional regulator
MNNIITSREEILAGSKRLIGKKGLSSLNMRNLADYLHVSVGTLYNYFPSKEDLFEESVEAVFKDIFHEKRPTSPDFLTLLDDLTQSLKDGEKRFPGFFASHSVFFPKNEQKEASQRKAMSQDHLKEQMKAVLDADPKVRKDVFQTMDEEEFIDLVFTSLLYSFLARKDETKTLKAMVSRILYAKEA